MVAAGKWPSHLFCISAALLAVALCENAAPARAQTQPKTDKPAPTRAAPAQKTPGATGAKTAPAQQPKPAPTPAPVQPKALAPTPSAQKPLSPFAPVDTSKPPPMLPRATRERMRACAEEWENLKLTTKNGLPMWRDFATSCLTR